MQHNKKRGNEKKKKQVFFLAGHLKELMLCLLTVCTFTQNMHTHTHTHMHTHIHRNNGSYLTVNPVSMTEEKLFQTPSVRVPTQPVLTAARDYNLPQ